MADIRLKRITIEQDQSPLQIRSGDVEITSTTSSTSFMHGALAVHGGVAISCGVDSSSATAGGGLSVGGGASVHKSFHVGENIVVDTAVGNLRLKGISQDRLFVGGINEKLVSIAPNGLDTQVEFLGTSSRFLSTAPSTSASQGAVLFQGGVSINATENSSSATQGGSLTVAGGAAIEKALVVGQGITSFATNTIGNVITTSSGNVGIGTSAPVCTLAIVGNASQGQLSIHNPEGDQRMLFGSDWSLQSSAPHFSLKHEYGVSNTVFHATNIGNVGIATTNPVCTLDVNGTLRVASGTVLESPDNTIGSLHTTQNGVGIDTTAPEATLHVNGSLQVQSSSTLLGTTQIQNLVISSVDDTTHIQSGLVDPNKVRFLLGTNGSARMTLSTTGAVGIGVEEPTRSLEVNGDAVVSGSVTFSHNSNTLGNLYTTGGNVGIGIASPQTNLHVYNADTAQFKLQGDQGHLVFHAGGETCVIETSQTLLINDVVSVSSTGNLGLGIAEPTERLEIAGNVIVTGGSISALSGGHTIGALSMDEGSVLVSGSLDAQGIVNFVNTRPSTSSSTGSLVVEGGISVRATEPATSITSGGAFTCAGGASIEGDTYIGGVTRFMDSTPSTSYSEGAVYMAGGLTITQAENAVQVGNGGALTVQGGAAIGGDLHVGGQINGSGSSSSTFAYLTLTATDEAVNLSTGTLVTFGGITIQCTTNANSIEDGGALLVNGGASVYSDLYVGGHIYASSPFNAMNPAFEFLNVYDDLEIKRFSFNMDSSTKNLTFSRYDSLGNFTEEAFEIMASDGIVKFHNTIPSTSEVSASILVSGGITVLSTQDSQGLGNGGALSVFGGASVEKDMMVGGNVHIFATTASNDVSSGSLLVDGGVGVAGHLHVLGNTVVNGDLTVRGTTTSVDSTNTVVKDNVFVLNSGPVGSKDAGFVIDRYQQDNDAGAGDVVNAPRYTTFVIPLQNGVSNNAVKLSSAASSTDDAYVGWWIKVASGFSSNQVRQIVAYSGSSRTATVSTAWSAQNPGLGDNVYLYDEQYVGLVFNELSDRFEFGGSAQNPDATNVNFTKLMPVSMFSGTFVSTEPCSASSSGAVEVQGGVKITCTQDATSVSSGGSLMTLGGASVGKRLYTGSLTVNGTEMTPHAADVYRSQQAAILNNQTETPLGYTASEIVWGFDMYLAARITTSGENMYANFHVRAVNKETSWELATTYVGDDTGIEFGITNSGQVVYTTPNYNGFTQGTFVYRVFAN